VAEREYYGRHSTLFKDDEEEKNSSNFDEMAFRRRRERINRKADQLNNFFS
jgi:hypothetical protein